MNSWLDLARLLARSAELVRRGVPKPIQANPLVWLSELPMSQSRDALDAVQRCLRGESPDLKNPESNAAAWLMISCMADCCLEAVNEKARWPGEEEARRFVIGLLGSSSMTAWLQACAPCPWPQPSRIGLLYDGPLS